MYQFLFSRKLKPKYKKYNFNVFLPFFLKSLEYFCERDDGPRTDPKTNN